MPSVIVLYWQYWELYADMLSGMDGYQPGNCPSLCSAGSGHRPSLLGAGDSPELFQLSTGKHGSER